ncbi:MAG: hypothetical protein AB1918_01365 [Pseudomonadota bacterium]
MNVLPKVLGLTVAGVLVIVLYLSTSVIGALTGAVAAPSAANPMGFMIYLGLLLTAVFLGVVMYLASTGGTQED